jgi:two-component system CheB/CheR fusion protein
LRAAQPAGRRRRETSVDTGAHAARRCERSLGKRRRRSESRRSAFFFRVALIDLGSVPGPFIATRPNLMIIRKNIRAPRKDLSPATATFPIVGLGASAGGLEAFTQLLAALPLDTGCGFVLVQHLDPQHQSELRTILARSTKMPVREATHGLRIEPNYVYVIPPNKTLGVAHGVLELDPRPATGAPHHSIDAFFEALAHDQRERAIGVVLSGSGTDGTLGLEMIRAEAGLTFAQDSSARYEAMPRSAIAAGCVDFVLPPAGIAAEIARIARHPQVAQANAAGRLTSSAARREAPPSARRTPASTLGGPVSGAPKQGESDYQKILRLLHKHSAVDFSLYKVATVERRIARRMVLCHQNTMEDYGDYLVDHPAELAPLIADVLINVTSFFRNPAAFEAISREIFPALLAAGSDEPVRLWVLGCSTGQEAYSLAMAFAEVAEGWPRARRLQVFATDLSEAMLEKARHGFYSSASVRSLSPERLKRFFVEEEGGYRIIKSLREQVVFARQNLLSDPPFSRLDLISCRNLLIYLDAGLQQKIMPTFHYALKPGGFLFLGASESIGRFVDLFEPVNQQLRLYTKKTAPAAFHLPAQSDGTRPEVRWRSTAAAARSRPARGSARDVREELEAQREADRVTTNHFAPPAVLIDAQRQILQFRGATGAFFKTPSGKASFDVLKMARDGLMIPLRAALNETEKTERPFRKENVVVNSEHGPRKIHLDVVPLNNLRARSFLVLFTDAETVGASAAPPLAPRHPPAPAHEMAERLRDLEQELAETRQYLQSVQEQEESSHEELEAANAEGQSANEELQSLNEELETSKEELQSTNEELTTVNEEMVNRNAELNQLNSDLTNLQASLKLPIVLLDRDLTVRRFSAQAGEQLGLQATDLGHRLDGRRQNLLLPELSQVVAGVMDRGEEFTREVQDQHGHWQSLRVRPYLNAAGQTDGAVLAVVDIDALKRTEGRIVAEREHAEAIIRTVPNPLLILTAELRVQFANDAFYRVFRLAPDEVAGRPLFELAGSAFDLPRLRELLEDIIPRNSSFNEFELTHNFPRLGPRSLLIDGRLLNARDGRQGEILVGIQDITEMLAFQSGLRRSELRYRRLFEASQDGVLLVDPGTRRIVDANPFMTALLGYTHEELCGKELFEIGLLADATASEAAFLELRARGSIRYEHLPLQTKSGERREVEFVSNLYSELEDAIIQCNIRDITDRTRTSRRLKEKARLLDLTRDAVIVRDLGDNITLWNKGAEVLFGWTAAAAIGQHLHTLLQTEFPKPMPEIVAQIEREGHFTGEVTQIARDGRRMPSLCRWVLDRETDSILTTYTDLTEFREMQSAIRAGEERYRTLFNSIDEGFCIIEMLFDEHGRPHDYIFLEANPAFEMQSGLVGAVGQRMRTLAPQHEDHWFETYGAVAVTGNAVRFEAESHELHRWFNVYAIRLGGPESRRVGVLFTDVTERRQNDLSLHEAQARLSSRAVQLESLVNDRTVELTATNKQLEAFVYSIAHDLRAPLRAMQVFSSMLLEETKSLSESAQDYARRVNKSAAFLDSLLRDLLAFSRISQEQVEFTAVNVKDVVENTLSLLSEETVRTGARIDRPSSWPAVLAHEPTLTQVMLNLLNNALKFVRPGEAPVIRLWSEERGQCVRVWVVDRGIGIDAAHHEQIFRLFNRLNGNTYPGTGVGLAIVQRALQRMGGHIGVESDSDGARFWFELPRADAPRLT